MRNFQFSCNPLSLPFTRYLVSSPFNAMALGAIAPIKSIPIDERPKGAYNLSYMTFEQFDRITQDPCVMGGKPCIRGMRVTVGMIVGQIGEGVSIEELLSDYPYLEREDVSQALRYAAALSQWREVALAEA